MRPPLLVALLASARALAPAALAREALVAYRASEENVAADKVLARALRGESSFTDADRRVAADVFLGTATRLRRYEWICAQRGLCGAASDATAVAAALLRARDEDDGAYTWPADADERLSATSGAPLWLCARWRRDLGEAVAAAVADQSTRRGPVTLRVRDDVSIGAVEEALAAAGVVTERPPAGVGNGGKSLALAARAKELWRAGVAVRCSDGESIPDAAFDLVLVDAPCSGSGVLRRLGRTLSLLREAASRCHDRLVYATCSILREENEEVVAAFDDDAGFEPWPFSPRLEGADGHTRRLLPNRHHDGFFIARATLAAASSRRRIAEALWLRRESVGFAF
ncbi:hypothetical protein EMIHUDRAFT_201999 [Emiliania huxleyi CCMP1516]|uniref:SAM-dependent methyltransferase RsmB-F/NOP2-type catalytic core domain-containing protein n=2 Tax=Emiliania huxleyi TaxID=2903 RepID=A0A0D3KEV6_EMIH1|nr:hypothetical protein EMIHUDRAFT_201999 [Emiliania huxleyi CCMP1516]EOD34291.1 hypothetical protein EMIHUDRAFT_201999 [Emiliania huxleyi CCMP1516]|eukprot:XP_005786720.1 hypothetical protein EMIHUDRAFT_201999 [Emiliania huxleyi CCMP1516]